MPSATAGADAEVVAPSLALLARAASRQRAAGDRRPAAGPAGGGERLEREGRTDSGGSTGAGGGGGSGGSFSAAPHQNR